MRKRICAFVLIISLLCPMVSHAAQQVTFEAALKLTPDNFSEGSRSIAQGLSEGIGMLSWEGDLTFNKEWMAALKSHILVDGKETISLDARSTSRRIELASNILGDERLTLAMEAYFEFAIKPYHFLELKTQYIALLTSRYAHYGAWQPVLNVIEQYTQGDGTRTISKERVLEATGRLSSMFEDSRELTFWFVAALMDMGLSDTVQEYFVSLGKWFEDNVDESGLHILVDGNKTTWSIGNTVLFTLIEDGVSHQRVYTLPEQDGLKLTGSFSSDQSAFAIVAQLVSADEGTLLEVKLNGSDLPNKVKGAGESRLGLKVAGDYVTPINENIQIGWAWDVGEAIETLHIKADMLNAEEKPMLTLNATLMLKEGDEMLLHFTDGELDAGTPLFSVNEQTLSELVGRVKDPALETLLPLFLKFPVSFYQVLVDWTADSGIIAMLIAALQSSGTYFDEE